MKARPFLFALALLSASLALAGGIEDGNAGLAALNRGAYDEAIRLFNRAIKAPDLSPDDRELAYLNRGKAYLAKKAYTLAAADFRQAKRMRPDDGEAADGLRLALAHGRGAPVVRAPTEAELKARWGIMAALPDKIWLLSGNKPEAYLRYSWRSPGRVLTFEGLDRKGRTIAGQCALADDGSGIDCATAINGVSGQSAIAVANNAFQETAEGSSLRETYTWAGADHFRVDAERLQNGAWAPLRIFDLAAVSPDRIAALRWKPHKPSGFGKFMGDLGKGLLGMMASSVADATQQPAQDDSSQGDPPPQ